MNKRAAAGAAAVILAAGVGTHMAFEPEELVHSADDLARRHSVTQYAPARSEESGVLAALEDYERISLPDAIRGRFIRLPVAVKSAVLLPLWALGALPAAVLGHAGGALLALALQIGVLAGLFALVYKLLFPEKKVRELFRKKNLKWLFVGALTVTAANVLLTELWTGWPLARTLLLSIVGAAVLGLMWKRLCGAFKAPEPDIVSTRLVADV